jgi:hypothetical protein
MCAHARNDDARFTPNISGSVIHGDAEDPLVRTHQFFISQTPLPIPLPSGERGGGERLAPHALRLDSRKAYIF